tara:strand:+ start:5196 stop:6623 length:1428 start_codon:yes stop_codon:yes gene_type:complete
MNAQANVGNEPLRVLLVGATNTDAELTVEFLESTQTDFGAMVRASTLDEAKLHAHDRKLNIVLLDISSMQTVTGDALDPLQRLIAELPLVVLGEEHQSRAAKTLLEQGAQDFLIKGDFNSRTLERAINYAIHRKQSESRFRHLAQYDVLTGLANRTLFEERLDRAIRRAKRHGTGLAVMYLDLDRFKRINDSLGHDADAALYLAKNNRRSTYRFYTQALDACEIAKMERQRELERAISSDDLHLVYQPKIDLRDGSVAGAEALVRWHLPNGDVRYPADFIPAAESSGLIVQLGERVMHDACVQARVWDAKAPEGWRVAVNVSGRQLETDSFVETLDAILVDTGLKPEPLEIELTESALVADPDSARELLSALRARDIAVSIDDFGTGYCSLSYLRNFPVDTLKIDQSFVQGANDAVNLSIVRAIVDLARALELGVVAEGVETAEQMYTMQLLGADVVQGYLLGRSDAAQHLELTH